MSNQNQYTAFFVDEAYGSSFRRPETFLNTKIMYTRESIDSCKYAGKINFGFKAIPVRGGLSCNIDVIILR
jgi:hypothetical protein